MENVSKMIKSLDNLIMRNTSRPGDCVGEKKLPPMQGMLLGFLYMNRECTIYQKDLEREFGLPKSTLATLLKQLDAGEYITRKAAEHDSRLKCIILSEKGISLQKDFIHEFESINQYICEGISQEEIDTFLATGMKFKSNLETRLAIKESEYKGKESNQC